MALQAERRQDLRKRIEGRQRALAAELRDLEVARLRLAGGSYGVCTDCGAQINYDRLRANPAAARCVACQTRYEKTHTGRGTPTL